MESDTQVYVVRYVYDNPPPGGPHKGKTELRHKVIKGDSIYGPFGYATITSCRLKNAEASA